MITVASLNMPPVRILFSCQVRLEQAKQRVLSHNTALTTDRKHAARKRNLRFVRHLICWHEARQSFRRRQLPPCVCIKDGGGHCKLGGIRMVDVIDMHQRVVIIVG